MTFHRRNFLLATASLAACKPKLLKPLNGYVYAASAAARSLSVISLARFKLVKELPLEAEPTAVLIKPGTHRVFVLTPSNGHVIEVEGASATIVRRIRTGSTAVSMRLSPGGEALWVLSRDPQALLQIDLQTGKIVRTIKLPHPPSDFDLNPAQPLAVVDTALVNLQQGRMERPLALESGSGLVRFRPDGKQVLAAYPAARLIAVTDVTTGGLLVKLPLPLEPRHFCFTHLQGGQLFVSGPGMDAVAIVYPYQTVLAETILAGRSPGAMAIDSEDRFLFVANPESGDLTVLSIADRGVMAKIPVGQKPSQILFTPDHQYVLVFNHGSSDMAVIRLSKIAETRTLFDTRSRRAPLFTIVPMGEGPVSAAICPLSS